jgi:hypothetical protein
MATPGKDKIRYEVITQEDPESGDVLLPIPPQLLEQLGWREGDDVEIGIDPQGNIILKKSNK